MSTVLIVDDALFVRFSLRTIIEKHGFIVVGEAQNGLEAVEKYKETQPDIVTMDITMPGMTGIEALKEIRSFDSKACVVVISALGQESFVKEAIINGAKSFIVKPFNEEIVVAALKKLAAAKA